MDLGDAKITISADTKGFNDALSKVGKSMEEMGKKYQKVGKVMIGVGAALIGSLGMCAKAAEEERVNVARLSATLDNVGVSYDNVKDSLEAVILATQRKTGIADDQQRDALSELIIATGDYNRALSLLPLTLDFAAAKQMDVATSAELIGKIAQGNLGVLSRYGIVLEEGATAADALNAIQEKVTGSAEKMASPIDIMKASFSDMQESIGNALLPTLKELMSWMTNIFDKIGDWANRNPELIKTLLALGIALVGAGGLIMALSSISKAIIAINAALIVMKSLSGPAGWITLAAGLAIAGATIAGVNAMMNNAATNIPVPAGARPSMQYGGIVPGPIGQPVPIIAHGGERYLGPHGGNTEINLNIAGSVISERDLIQTVREEFLKIQSRNASLGFV